MSKTNVISNVDKEASKRKSKLLNVDTSCYENIIYNKKIIEVQVNQSDILISFYKDIK